jgi:ribonucleoside-diphosphate reductase alpha chain
MLAQKYFRKAGVPARLKKVEGKGRALLAVALGRRRGGAGRTARRRALRRRDRCRQVFDRLAGTWTYWGWKGGYFDSEEDARAFYDELAYMLATPEMRAPNSPQWFNTGLHWAYGIDGPGQGHFMSTPFTGKLTKSKTSYEHPQPHACFIQSSSRRSGERERHHGPVGARGAAVQIRLGHRLEFLVAARRRESLSGGGKSSGLMSFLKIGDRAAGAIKSGGTTRRAAKMVVCRHRSPRYRGISSTGRCARSRRSQPW